LARQSKWWWLSQSMITHHKKFVYWPCVTVTFYLQMKEENEQQKKDSIKCWIFHNKEKACRKNDIFYEISMKTKSSA